MQGERQRRSSGTRSMRLFEVLVVVGFFSILAFFVQDGFKEIFQKPEKPKQAEDSIAELKATIARTKELSHAHKYVVAGRGERRSALSTDPPPPPPRMLESLEIHQDPPKLRTFSNIVLVSAMQQQGCVAEGGDELHFLSVQNKQDYGRLHGYDFVLGIEQADPQLENMWNKLAWLLKVLEDEERAAEWVIWVDIDTVIIDANYTLPFDYFAAKSKDLVLYGNLTEIMAGHPVKALNTGVMLVRNTPWARMFFGEVARLGRLDDHHKGKNTLSQILLKELQAEPYSDGLRDQNAVIYLLKTHPEWLTRVALLDKEICINCYWRDLNGITGFDANAPPRQDNVTLVQHFMGCQTCTGQNRNGDQDDCRRGMQQSFRFVKQYQAPMLKDAPPQSERDRQQLANLPLCYANEGNELCAAVQPRAAQAQAGGASLDIGLSDASLGLGASGSGTAAPEGDKEQKAGERIQAGGILNGQGSQGADPRSWRQEADHVRTVGSESKDQDAGGRVQEEAGALASVGQDQGHGLSQQGLLSQQGSLSHQQVERREVRAVGGEPRRVRKHRKTHGQRVAGHKQQME